jgi:23S rRNA pseudouridine1911/1915/1917 synthase
VPPDLAGQRLDAAIRKLRPRMGLRGVRRAIARGLVLRNGRIQDAACRLRAGDILEIRDTAESRASTPPRFLFRQGKYVFVDKPAGLHCAELAGSGEASLEGFLPEILPPDCAQARLLQRLDRHTSGLVCAASDKDAAQAFRLAEREGRCDKFYLALLEGFLAGAATVRLGLDTADRRKSRLGGPTDDMTRWTEFRPLLHLEGEQTRGLLSRLGTALAGEPLPELTLALCRIRRGARHQIRVHALSLSCPLLGDALYGKEFPPREISPREQADSPPFFLHHTALAFPGGDCFLPPPWDMPQDWMRTLREYFRSFRAI